MKQNWPSLAAYPSLQPHTHSIHSTTSNSSTLQAVMGEPKCCLLHPLGCAAVPCPTYIAAFLLAPPGPKQKHLGNHSNNCYGDRTTLVLILPYSLFWRVLVICHFICHLELIPAAFSFMFLQYNWLHFIVP